MAYEIKNKKAQNHNPFTEFQEQQSVLKLVRLQWPKVDFFSDGSGQNLGKQAGGILTSLRSRRGISDIIIPEPSSRYCGLFIELKKTGESLFQKRDPSKWISEHVAEQAAFLKRRNELGYFATFAIGREEAFRIIRRYFQQDPTLEPYPPQVRTDKKFLITQIAQNEENN